MKNKATVIDLGANSRQETYPCTVLYTMAVFKPKISNAIKAILMMNTHNTSTSY